jgi:uncharacterized damage-inducible protein DinB
MLLAMVWRWRCPSMSPRGADLNVDRTDPPKVADERAMLDAWLDFHRATLAMKCEGLSPDQLRIRAAAPSTLSLLGLVRHMTEVERGWFRQCLMGEDVLPLYYSDAEPDGDFDLVDDADPDEMMATWRAECDNSSRLAADAPSLDTVGVNLRRGEQVSLRWIMVHMIEEYARHNGHADLLRQRIDGSVGD